YIMNSPCCCNHPVDNRPPSPTMAPSPRRNASFTRPPMHRYDSLVLLLSSCLLLPLFAAKAPKEKPSSPKAVLPAGADGNLLNFDLETGTLKAWKAEGEACAGQPVKGDTVSRRRGDMKSQHQGNYWIGTYERKGDGPKGTLTSVPFKVTHPWASFLIGGGPW